MRQSQLFANTLREAPAEAEVTSHRLLLRAGFIRQLAAGIYIFMPLGLRVLQNVERILRDELERAGANELLMPALQPTELWKESGRYDVYGPELIRLTDRHHREFALGPTHEEVVTMLMKNEINSYRQLPVTVYQIQTKFRDERRPRSGLLRGREFLMKDAYSFDTTWDGLNRSYRAMYDAYHRIFERCGLTFRAVEADAGAIGGEGGTHEFMALADIGEDTIAVCTHCGYSANIEKAISREECFETEGNTIPKYDKIHTPGVHTIKELTEYLKIKPVNVMKTLIYLADGNPVAVIVRGDHEVNEIKVKNALGAETLTLSETETTESVTGAKTGFAGPIGLSIPLLVDKVVIRMKWGITGANESEYHIKNVVPGRDFSVEHVGDFRNVKEDEACSRCEEGKLRLVKGIEVGHVFKLGTKYSEALKARYLDANGKEQPIIMGCYGIGVSRIVSAIVEQYHDERGIVWPPAIAPYRVHLIPVSIRDDMQRKIAEDLYDALRQIGIDVLLDDRDERAGVKFNDSDLIGLPIRIVVGKDAIHGKVEYVERSENNKQLLSVEEVVMRINTGDKFR
ncbi:proline--tRNA ligase [Paenibacillus sp. YYML68]|uniref:proline--tRNA ligase n=1 Tax=Paenibacillus sp. YYML68 TaxID=2909250 RepID=UPI0024930A86|nr:proline--tRNA ligase [Paenibacillus sp. YYML68]